MKTFKIVLKVTGIQLLVTILYITIQILLGMLFVELGFLDKLSGESEAIAKTVFALIWFYFWSSLAIVPVEYDKTKKCQALIKMFFVCYLLGILYFGIQFLWSSFIVTEVHFLPLMTVLLIFSIVDASIRYILLPILIWKISKKVLKGDFTVKLFSLRGGVKNESV